jgi:hypothetical protein
VGLYTVTHDCETADASSIQSQIRSRVAAILSNYKFSARADFFSSLAQFPDFPSGSKVTSSPHFLRKLDAE